MFSSFLSKETKDLLNWAHQAKEGEKKKPYKEFIRDLRNAKDYEKLADVALGILMYADTDKLDKNIRLSGEMQYVRLKENKKQK